DDVLLARWDDHVVDADGDTGLRRIEETHLLEVVEHLHREVVAVVDEAVVHQLLQTLLLEKTVDERDLRRNVRVEDDAADGRLDELLVDVDDLGVRDVLVVELLGEIHETAADADADRREELDLAGLQRDHHVVEAAEGLAFTLRAGLRLREVVAA